MEDIKLARGLKMESSMQGGVFKYKVENLGVLYIGTSKVYLWQHKLGNYVEQDWKHHKK